MMNKMMKKIAVAFAAATMAITAFATMASANDGMGIDNMANVSCSEYSATKYVVAQSGANVRTAPSTDYSVLNTVEFGQAVNVCGKTNNGWYQLLTEDSVYGGQAVGYIAGNLLDDTKPAAQQTNSYTGKTDAYGFKADSNMAEKTYYTVSVADGTYLALRNAPTSDASAEIGQLHNGDTVCVIEGSGQFWMVDASSVGRVGYVNSNYLV